MAKLSNSARSKRKYNDSRKAVTVRNREAKRLRHDLRQAKMVERTQKLIGQHAAVRIKGNIKPLVGTVTDVLRHTDEHYPLEARRHTGAYLKVRTAVGDVIASRHRSKPIKDRK